METARAAEFQPSNSNDAAAPASESANVQIIFREIHKNAWLRRLPTRPGVGGAHSKRGEQVWVVFCVHDDRDAYLELYVDEKVAAAHRPDWCAPLASCLHVTPTICASQEGHHEFVVTLRTGIIKLAAPSWELMMEWVTSLRSKLEEMKILTPPENLYSQPPQLPRGPLLPTRDPNSPLPPPPAGPRSLVPGVEALQETLPAAVEGSSTEEAPSPPVSHPVSLVSPGINLYIGPARDTPPSTSEAGRNVTVIEVSGPVFELSGVAAALPAPQAGLYEHLFPDPVPPEPPRPPALPPPRPQEPTDLANSTTQGQRTTAAVPLSPRNVERLVDAPPPSPRVPEGPPLSPRTTEGPPLSPRATEGPPLSPRGVGQRRRGPRLLPAEPPPPRLRLQPVPLLRPALVGAPPPGAVLTLREQQVLQLTREIRHPGGVRLQIRRKDCSGAIALIDAFGAVWVAGWKQREHPTLYNALHIGDRLLSVAGVPVPSAAEAHRLIRATACVFIEIIVRRVPCGRALALRRTESQQDLGLELEGGSAEVRLVRPLGPAARAGLPPKAPSCDGLSLTNWVLTEVNSRPLNLFSKEGEARDRLNALGADVSILVQPLDLVKQLKKQLKALRGYKDYLVQ